MLKCCVPNCPNSYKNISGIPFFSFPNDKQIRKLWLEALKIDFQKINEFTRVCIRHFEEDDVFRFSTTTKLKKGRVPRLCVNADVEENTVQDVIEHNLPETTSKKIRMNLIKRRRNKQRLIAQFYGFRPTFLIENFWNNNKKICRYTGIPTRRIFVILYNFVFKSEKEKRALHTSSTNTLIKRHNLSPLNQLFLTMIRLRIGTDYHMLGDMFWISESTACRIFKVWIKLLCTKLGTLNIFPHKTVLMEIAPWSFLQKYPDVIGSIVCVEFTIESPSSIRQSQYFSRYEGNNTLKGLIMIDANGAIIFVSALHPGSISDRNILEGSGFVELLRKKVNLGELEMGDIILADEGFNIHSLIEDVELELNIPTIRFSGIQFIPNEVEHIRKIARERAHVERAIRRMKIFKILTNKIPVSSLGYINQIYTTCALLTNFKFPLRK